MGARGPAPKPTQLRVLEGNPSNRPLPKGEVMPEATMPEMPTGMSPVAIAHWKKQGPKLHRLGLLTEIDGDAFGKLCDLEAQYAKARGIINRKGLTFTTPAGYIQQRPEVGVMNRCWTELLRYYAHFGQTPSSRSRINLGEALPESDDGILS
jgi:P27 family predicted phage terminase small subunit